MNDELKTDCLPFIVHHSSFIVSAAAVIHLFKR
jgi:hypothetical protein